MSFFFAFFSAIFCPLLFYHRPVSPRGGIRVPTVIFASHRHFHNDPDTSTMILDLLLTLHIFPRSTLLCKTPGSRWWLQMSGIFYPREMIQFDGHIFQMGLFNHQLDWIFFDIFFQSLPYAKYQTWIASIRFHLQTGATNFPTSLLQTWWELGSLGDRKSWWDACNDGAKTSASVGDLSTWRIIPFSNPIYKP